MQADLKAEMENKMQNLFAQLKEMEENLNQKIAENTKVVVQAAPVETTIEVPMVEAEPEPTPAPAQVEASDPNKMMSTDDIAALFASRNACGI